MIFLLHSPRYPELEEDGYRYLCSGGIIGYAPVLYEIISLKAVNHTDDDQLYYTHIFLDNREAYNIKLDRQAKLFQVLYYVVCFLSPGQAMTTTHSENMIFSSGPLNYILN